MSNAIGVYISSKQVEFEIERAVLADKIRSLPFLEPVIAKEWPPERRTIEEVFLDEVRQAPIYVGLFHRIYSAPTEVEYRTALENEHRELLIYLKRSPEEDRAPELRTLIREFQSRHTVVEFTTIGDLLPVFTNHLGSALVRMISLLQKLGERPLTRSSNSILARRWDNQNEALLRLGLPTEPQVAVALGRQLAAALGEA